jgi:UDP-N-acetylglucosamine 2-epimerase (non-hydrolysing)
VPFSEGHEIRNGGLLKRLSIVLGTRPEAIKMAPVLLALRNHDSKVQTQLVVSSQHREMLYQALAVFEILPDVDLDIMTDNQTLFQITIRGLARLGDLLEKEPPDILLVQGDTTTAFAATLAAFYRKIPVGHVEAGLRTDHMFDPFPEEMNRRLIDHLSTLLFAPTSRARDNLLKEGIKDSSILVTGNTVVDALLSIRARIDAGQAAVQKDVLDLASNANSGLILLTAHRRESFGLPLQNICLGVKDVARLFPQKMIVFPVHLNPRVREPVRRLLQNIGNVRLIEPLDYVSFVYLMSKADLILTDSGGIQEEATCLNKPTLVLREYTERVEAEEAGFTNLIGTDAETISRHVQQFFGSQADARRPWEAVSPYGDGRAAERIALATLKYLGVD